MNTQAKKTNNESYLIFDVNKPLMSGYTQINSNSGSNAIKQYCKENYPNQKAICSADSYVQLSVRRGYCDDNGKYWFVGGKKQTWYKLISLN